MPLNRENIEKMLNEAPDRGPDGISLHLVGGPIHFSKIVHVIAEQSYGNDKLRPFEVTGFVTNHGNYKESEFCQVFFHSSDVVAISRPQDKTGFDK